MSRSMRSIRLAASDERSILICVFTAAVPLLQKRVRPDIET